MTRLHILQKGEHRVVQLYQRWEALLLHPFGGLHLQVILEVFSSYNGITGGADF